MATFWLAKQLCLSKESRFVLINFNTISFKYFWSDFFFFGLFLLFTQKNCNNLFWQGYYFNQIINCLGITITVIILNLSWQQSNLQQAGGINKCWFTDKKYWLESKKKKVFVVYAYSMFEHINCRCLFEF